MKLTAKASLQIQKPIEEVFEAVVNPEHISKYFIAKSSGRMESDTTLHWEFGDFPGEFPVEVKDVKAPQVVRFVWDQDTVVEIAFDAQDDQSTVVRITEGEKELSEENLEWLIGNTFGWGNFLDCLKAYLEYGINLRKGAFNYLKQDPSI
ncbi:MAG TPA: SRPBCC domain-containing protein [Cyclobacteriaceae bacterium]|nr:SRPBCC domain-containing protein [Cyclobacteriaceae bacterium]